MLSYDPYTNIILLSHRTDAVLVDATLCLDPEQPQPLLRHPKAKVMIIGEVERAPELSRAPPLGQHMEPPDIDTGLIVRAIFMKEADDIDLDLWEKAVQAREKVVAPVQVDNSNP
ncbi:hypothetical protein BOTBODRAFT_26310 [Botryobasidium botryosum FD-172 SS1]|uniref:Uncharacterized protein n=1 Tax=Botryobasidium botryosum (strain FD-172 SS1) TaxID=930990 RepID=A0A067N1N3_BOTB1|nr:hypothetical protein BOTBODRAFT_26310 [Botryobasidium botryosum FD-172 SS1]